MKIPYCDGTFGVVFTWRGRWPSPGYDGRSGITETAQLCPCKQCFLVIIILSCDVNWKQ